MARFEDRIKEPKIETEREPILDLSGQERLRDINKRLDQVYGPLGVSFEVSQEFFEQIQALDNELETTNDKLTYNNDLANLRNIARKNPEEASIARSLASLVRRDKVLENILETRRQMQKAVRDAARIDQEIDRLQSDINDLIPRMSEDSQKLDQLRAELILFPSYGEKEFEVNERAAHYLEAQEQGRNPALVGLSIEDLERAQEYRDKRKADSNFDKVAGLRDEIARMKGYLQVQRENKARLNLSKAEKSDELKEKQSEIKQLMDLFSKSVTVAELQEGEFQNAVRAEKLSEIFKPGQDVIIALDTDEGRPYAYQILEVRSGNALLLRTDQFSGKGFQDPLLIQSELSLTELVRRGRPVGGVPESLA